MRQDSIGKCVAQFLEVLIQQMEETLSPIEFTDSVSPSAHDVYLHNFHDKLDKAISIEDVKALLSAEVMFTQSIS